MSIEVDFTLHQPGGFTLNTAFSAPGSGVTALFGRSGSGKTTILRCIAGLQRATGFCRVNDEIWQDADHWIPTHHRPIGYVFQEASLFPHLSVRNNLRYGMRRGNANDQRIGFDDAVELLGIAPLLQRSTVRLSGGERQRVAIARALLSGPRLLLMDEPLSALDHDAKRVILPYLERLYSELKIPVLYVSHDPQEVARLADRMVLLESGQVSASGPVNKMMSSLHLPLASFDNASAVLSGVVDRHDDDELLTHVVCGGHRFTLPRADLHPGGQTRLQVFASDVSIALHVHHDSTISNILPVVISGKKDVGRAQMLVKLQLDDGQQLLARITRRSGTALGLREGMMVYAQIKAVALLG